MSSETTAPYDIAGKRVCVAGHAGMVGSAIVRRLAGEECEILTAARDTLDLRRQAETEAWIGEHKPHAVVVAAAKVGGILANDSYPAEFIYDNLMIEANLIQAAWRAGEEALELCKEKVEVWKREEFHGEEGVWRANRDGARGVKVDEDAR